MLQRLNRTIILIIVFAGLADSALKAQSSEDIRKYTENIRLGIVQDLEGEIIHATNLLPDFYFENGFQKVWGKSNQRDVLKLLAEASDRGLEPSDYHLGVLTSMFNDPLRSQSVEADLLFTDAFLLYASHILNGKLNPEVVEGEWKALRREGNAKMLLNDCVLSGNFNKLFEELEPNTLSYKGLIKELKKYNELLDKGGWETIDHGETFKPEMSGARILSLKKRLALEGYLKVDEKQDDVFSPDLREAVMSFQKGHGLEVDGTVGNQTINMLNIPVEKKIEIIKVNLERLRWLNQELGDHYIFVNIADYTMKVYKNERMVYQQTVVVGKPIRKTPVFSDRMTYFVLNPYWTVPPTILFNDVLPEVKKSTEYLKTKNMKVLKGNQEVNPENVEWSSLSRNNFPYVIRQEPGAHNALGVVKFMFPNKYNIYIHDTPSKELFNRPDRAFSSGCIRLNQPLEFVDYLLNDIPEWDKMRVQGELKNGRDKTVMLKKPMAVHILYLTSWVDENGVQFRNDVYQRDSAVTKALSEKAPSLNRKND